MMIDGHEVVVEYDGKPPKLCFGSLVITIDGTVYFFGMRLNSGGNPHKRFEPGAWSIDWWPYLFPEELTQVVIKAINEAIPQGCCGGCA